MNPFDQSPGLAAHERMPAGRVYDKLNAASEDARLIAEALEARRLHDAAVRAKYKALMKERARERGRINEAKRRERLRLAAQRHHENSAGAVRAEAKQRG